MKFFTPAAALLLCLFIATGCADYRPHVVEETVRTPADMPTEKADYSVMMVGDLGYRPQVGLDVLKAMEAQYKELDADKSALLILGDISGPEGMRKGDDEEDATIERFLTAFNRFPGRVFVTPGERELGGDAGFDRLKRLEKFAKKNSDKKIRFMPNRACSGPDDEELTDEIGLIGFNSAWYLGNWEREEEANEGCDINNRDLFMLAAGDEIKGYRDKVKIVMMHHPLQSNGNRGGRFSLKQHLLPVPVVGTAVRLLQSAAGGRQDLASLLYKKLISGLKFQIEDETNVIFVGGHEHNMMYVPEGHYHVVTAGTGSVVGPATGGEEAAFVQGALGFGRMDFYPDGSVWLNFFRYDEQTGRAERAYTTRMIEDRFADQEPPLAPIPADTIREGVVKTTVYDNLNTQRSTLFEGLLGRHYRPLYQIPVEAPILDLDNTWSGLTPYRRGGGMTTMSLHMRGNDNHLYQMRSIRKNPAQLLPYPISESFVVDIVKDQFTALHPFGAMVVPPFAKAIGILHPEPIYGYAPKQPILGSFNNFFGGELYQLEQRPDEDWSGSPLFAGSKSIIGNDDVIEEMQGDWKVTTDQRAYVRARLLDVWLGDWDRHRDQWRWAKTKQNGRTVYEPVPRDRDQVFSHFDGTLLRLVALLVPDARKLKPFDYELDHARWRSLNGKWNDRLFMNQLTEADFVAAAELLQNKLTDALIDSAMLTIPEAMRGPTVDDYDIDGKLRARRAMLVDYARDYYYHLAENVDIPGTDKGDYFRATRNADGTLLVEVFDRSKDNQPDERYYSRLFQPGVTKEVRLYGLDGKDFFELTGEGRSGVAVRIIGGPDDDTTIRGSGGGRAVLIDGKNGYEIEGKGAALRVRPSRSSFLNQYSHVEYQEDYTTPFPTIGFNQDDGLFFGLGAVVRRYGWKPDPYKTQHSFKGLYSLNESFQLDYLGEFNRVFGFHRDFLFTVNYRSPKYVVNYFGMGNETVDINETEEGEDIDDILDFNRSLQQRLFIRPHFRWRGTNNRLAVTVGPTFQLYQVDSTVGRFITTEDANLPARIFDEQLFAGAEAAVTLNTLAFPTIPTNGLSLDASVGYFANVTDEFKDITEADEEVRDFIHLTAQLRYYFTFANRNISIATRIGAEHLEGDFEFYQAAQLSGRRNFRNIRSERFLGNTAFWHNTDLRLRGFGFGRGEVPTAGGILLGFDYGRVWLDGEDSDTWHTAYGGGLWLAPFNAAIISATYFTGADGQRFAAGIGFPF
ncbi:MAG: hypothetical protein WBA17_00265 [Saprospiraceae bacterium]